MKAIIFSFLLIFSVAASAQVSTNVYWSTTDALKANEVIYYNPSTPLTWSDFKGVPKPTGQTVALTASGFGYSVSASSGSNGAEINIAVYCYFSKPKSWVAPNSANAYILSHEQHHFDITYIFAKSFYEQIKKEKLTIANLNNTISKIYTQCSTQMSALQAEYDASSSHGINREMQESWHNKILGMLK